MCNSSKSLRRRDASGPSFLANSNSIELNTWSRTDITPTLRTGELREAASNPKKG
jgi:hypothetical protein